MVLDTLRGAIRDANFETRTGDWRAMDADAGRPVDFEG
jgi:hypothetical protein